MLLLILFGICCSQLKFSSAMNCAGCVPLDTLSFDKVLSKFPASLIKFDVAYPYGEKHDEFAKVSKEAVSSPDLFIGEVGIKDYGEKDNSELGERFNIGKEDYPTVYLFVKNNQKGSLEQHKFTDDFTAENLKIFLKSKSGIHIPMKGCIEELDNIAETFGIMAEEKKKKAISESEGIVADLPAEIAKNGKVYIKVMRKIVSDGIEFLAKEEARINKVLAGKLSDAKKSEMEERINILKSFQISAADGSRDEL